jgi:flavin reductase (DIM6/NTAB) family NADH-FMN oxidoreductase RutF
MTELSKLDVTDARSLRNVFGCFASGVTALCAMGETGPMGIVASSFTSVSVVPPLVSVCIQSDSDRWKLLSKAPYLGLSILAEDHDNLCRQIASRAEDRFAGISWFASEKNGVFIDGATAHFECAIHTVHEAGDHHIVVLEIESMKSSPDVAPLVFHGSRFRRLQVDA